MIVWSVVILDTLLVVGDGFFSFTGSVGPPSCVAEQTQWVLTREQVGKVRSQSYSEQ